MSKCTNDGFDDSKGLIGITLRQEIGLRYRRSDSKDTLLVQSRSRGSRSTEGDFLAGAAKAEVTDVLVHPNISSDECLPLSDTASERS